MNNFRFTQEYGLLNVFHAYLEIIDNMHFRTISYIFFLENDYKNNKKGVNITQIFLYGNF